MSGVRANLVERTTGDITTFEIEFVTGETRNGSTEFIDRTNRIKDNIFLDRSVKSTGFRLKSILSNDFRPSSQFAIDARIRALKEN